MDLKCNEKDQIKMNLGAIEKKDDGKAKQNQVLIKEMNGNDRTNLCLLSDSQNFGNFSGF